MTYSKKALRRDAYAAVAIDEVETRLAVVETSVGLGEGGALSLTNVDIAIDADIAPGKIAGTAVVDNDSRLTDRRLPSAHASEHYTAGDDALAAGDIGAIDLAAFKVLVAAAVDYAAFQTAVAAL